jgi:amino acid transporter
MNKSVENERTKLLAGFCNTVAAAFLTTGILAPIISTVYGLSDKSLEIGGLIVVSLACMLISAFLHIAGRSVLARMIE